MASNVGKNIAQARKQAGLTQEELAAKVGYKTKSAINKIELGLRDLPQKKIAAFAQALQVSPGFLMGWEQEPEELADIAAAVLLDADLMALVEDYMKLKKDSSKYAARLAIASLIAAEQEEQKKTDPQVSPEVEIASLIEIK